MKENIGHLRVNYDKFQLLEENIPSNPFELFRGWFENAKNHSEVIEPNAMTIATVDENNAPQIRIVLLKEYSLNGFVFFTNYDSKKGKELINNNNASILFFWESLHRQIRIQGKVEKIDRKDTIEYFNSRPYESRIGAIASNQSSHLESREFLEKRYQDLKQKYPENPPCPENWGGFILKPNSFEFWQGRESRLHDRIVYELINNDWKTKRLYP